jgi:hypothetical protein
MKQYASDKNSHPCIRLLHAYGEDRPPLILLDDGQDFEAIYAKWCQQDDAFCEGLISEKEWRAPEDFLRGQGVVILEPLSVDQLGDFYS